MEKITEKQINDTAELKNLDVASVSSEQDYQFKPTDLDFESIRQFYDGHSTESIFNDALKSLVKLCPTEEYGESEEAAAVQDMIGELYWRATESEQLGKPVEEQIRAAADRWALTHARIPESSEELIDSLKYTFEKAIRWFRMHQVENSIAIKNPDHYGPAGIAESTSRETVKLHVDNWPEILEFLRKYHPHRYDIYGDAITIFCDDKKHRKQLSAAIDIVRSVKS